MGKIKDFLRLYKEFGGHLLFNMIRCHKRLGTSEPIPFSQPVQATYEYYSHLDPSKYEKELKYWYRWRTGKALNLDDPQTYNEKIQWLKLYDTTPLKTLLSDKYLVREWLAERVGEEYLIPLLGVWDRFEDIDFERLPNRFVLKANHGSGWNLIVKDKSRFDIAEAKQQFDKWMSSNFAFSFGFELQYLNIPPKIIAEQYIDELDRSIFDYRFFCFDGEVVYIWLDVDSGTPLHRRAIFDLDWNLQDYNVNYPLIVPTPPAPVNFEKMKAFSELLSKGFPFVRVDFYEINGKLYMGEMTFTSQSGVGSWDDDRKNLEYGSHIRLPEKKPIPQKILFN